MTLARDAATIRRIFLIAGLALIWAGAARGQTTEMMTHEQVQDCLCQQQALTAADAKLKSQSSTYLQRQQELKTVEDQLKSIQATASPGDTTAVAKSQELIDRRNLLRDQLRSDATPYNASASAYNALVSKYNAECASKSMLSFDVEAAKKNLACPAPVQ